MRRSFVILTAFLWYSVQAQSIDHKSKIGYKSIHASNLKPHVNVLTSDSLEGRETTYRGQKKAALYIANFFNGLGLEPIGDDGTYFQHFDIEVSRIQPETKIITEVNQEKKTYTWRTDFITEISKDTTVSGPVAFVGFTDTELDSAALVKLVGRIVFVFIGKKDYANDTTKAATWRRLLSTRHDAGSLASLMIPDEEGPATFLHAKQLMSNLGSAKGTMKLKSDSPFVQPSSLRFLVSRAMAEELLKPSGKTLEEVKNTLLHEKNFSPIFIDNATLTIEAKVLQETRQTENVIGLLPGSDSSLKAQAVAFTAHYDHLGKNQEGVLFPGADDNSSGTAAILELAQAFVKNPIKPKRSLLFMTLVGEEKGLYGSQYYVTHPIIPLTQIIADLNMDMIGRIDPLHDILNDTNYIYVIGSDKISLELDSLLQAANNETEHMMLDYKYNDENDPEHLYRRSDHYNFAIHDIPIAFFFDGLHPDYHKPTDTADKLLFGRMEKICHLIYDLGWKLGNMERFLIKNPVQH